MNADNHDCVRLGVIVAWKQVDTLIDLDCPYGDSPCYKKALRQIEAWKNASETYPHDRKDLVKAIDRGTAMLSSGKISSFQLRSSRLNIKLSSKVGIIH